MLRAVYRIGSSIILPKPNDIDYLYLYDTNDERRKAIARNHDKKHDNHYSLFSEEPKVFLGCWCYSYMEHISGEEIPPFSIFDHKKEIKDLLLDRIMWFRENGKGWYHILILCYMFENKKMKLTKKQIGVVQKVHDEGITEELKDYCISILNNLE